MMMMMMLSMIVTYVVDSNVNSESNGDTPQGLYLSIFLTIQWRIELQQYAAFYGQSNQN